MQFRRKSNAPAVQIEFASLIDVVFLLLIFFMLTLKITAQEGDLGIDMPAVAEEGSPPVPLKQPPLHVRLIADAEGRLESLRFGEQSLGGGEGATEELRREMTALFARIGADREPIDVQIDADYELNYRHVIGTISAVSGRTEERAGEQRVIRYPVIIRFAPPRR
jgi:biopolymer transport protein ExbD